MIQVQRILQNKEWNELQCINESEKRQTPWHMTKKRGFETGRTICG